MARWSSGYSIHDNGQRIGRIRFVSERNPGVWLWHVQIHLPGPPYGSAASLAAVDGERPQPLGGLGRFRAGAAPTTHGTVRLRQIYARCLRSFLRAGA